MMEYITEYKKRKRDMKELWKDTFHDSDRYVDLVFDTYFSLEDTFVRYHENRLIAAMLTIPYEFQILTKEGKKEQLKGMYLCGLATHPEWRRRGIMAELMKEAEESAHRRGCDLAFLIPADENLRDYYGRKGYQTASWNSLKTFSIDRADSEGDLDSLHIYSIRELFQMMRHGFLEELAEWCRDIEYSRCHNTIIHSKEDMLAIMSENENSIFLTDCSFDPEYPILAKVRAVAFPEFTDASVGVLRIVGLYLRESGDDGQQNIHEEGQEYGYFEKETFNTILKKFCASELQVIMPMITLTKDKKRAMPYAMIKVLDENANSLKNENRAIEISLMLD